MSYGTIKVDTITFTNSGVDQSITVSGIVGSISGNITATGTVQANVVIGTTLVSGGTVTGDAGAFNSLTGNTAGFATVSGATVTGNVGSFGTITGGTVTLISGVFASGSAAAPSVSVGTTDNGIYSPGADQVAISTNGTGRLFVASDGVVRIESSTPRLRLKPANDTGSSRIEFVSTADVLKGRVAYDHSTNSLDFITNGSERLRITSDGKVGLGTSSPGAKLTVVGASNVYPTTETKHSSIDVEGEFFRIGRTDSDLRYHSIVARNSGTATTGNNYIQFKVHDPNISTTGQNTVLHLDGTGRVGVGTTSPLYTLDVAGDVAFGASGVAARVRARRPSDGSIGGYFGYNTTGSNDIYIVNASGSQNIVAEANSGAFIFNSSPSTERARIDSSGRLLVGTSSALDTVSIVPKIQSADAGNQAGFGAFRYSNDFPGPIIHLFKSRGTSVGTNTIVQNSDVLGEIRFVGADGTNEILGAVIKAFVDGTPGANDMPGRLVFSTTADGAASPTERMRIDSSGNVGVGTTSPTFGSGSGIEIERVSENATLRVERTTTNTSAVELRAGENVGVLETRLNKDLAFGTNSAERARIDSSGRLLVGTSSANTTHYASVGKVFIEGTGDASSSLVQTCWNATDTAQAWHILAKSGGASVGTRGIVASGELLGAIAFEGDDGTNFIRAAQIRADVDGTPGANDMPGRLVFSTTADGASSPTERMRITQDGNFYFNNTNTPSSAQYGTRISGGSLQGFLSTARNVDGTNTVFDVYGNAGRFRVLGDGNAENTNNSYTGISDLKLKENIVDANPQWDDIKALQVRNYNFKPETGYNTHTQIGLIAQEVELVSPGLVSESPDRDEDGNDLGTVTKSVNYSVLYMKAVKALQEAMERIETLEAKVAALESA